MRLADRFLQWIKPWIDRQMAHAHTSADWSYSDWLEAQQGYEKLYGRPWQR
jgi:hypothetical protein